MAKYRKKPVVIEAWQWNGTREGADILVDLILKRGGKAKYNAEVPAERAPNGELSRLWVPEHIAIDTLEGTMMALSDDYIIQGVNDEFYPCKPGIFEFTYNPA